MKPKIPLTFALPSIRLAVGRPVFSNTSVDYFGPMTVKTGRSTEKQWGCLFTCLTTRAIHLELAGSPSTDVFMHTLRQFIARRGAPQRIVSDNGTNFVGANSELKTCLSFWNQEQIHDDLLQKGIQWKCNPRQLPTLAVCGKGWFDQPKLFSDRYLVSNASTRIP